MKQSITSDFGGAARNIVDIIPFQNNKIIRAGKVDSLVIIAVTRHRLGYGAIELDVRDNNAIRG
jgi:hypothetical protein